MAALSWVGKIGPGSPPPGACASPHNGESPVQAQGRFAERFLGSCPSVETGTLARFGQEALAVAEQRLTENESTARRAVTIRVQLAQADELLESLGAASLVEVSEVLPGAYEQRLTRLAEQLQHHLRNHRVGTLEPLLDRLLRHRLAAVFGERTERMRMAVRLARWLRSGHSLAGGDARQTVLRYVAEGAMSTGRAAGSGRATRTRWSMKPTGRSRRRSSNGGKRPMNGSVDSCTRWPKAPIFERLVQQVIEAVDHNRTPRAQYGAVLIDEGHDFQPEWFRLIVQMVDPLRAQPAVSEHARA